MSQKHLSESESQMRQANLSRRRFLRGVGACIALPAMESFWPTGALAAETSAGALATTATGAPLRTAFVYFPNGAIPAAWWPSGQGRDFALNETMRSLETVKNNIQVISGLEHRTAIGGTDGGGDHARANGTFLTGVRLKKSATDLQAGPSIDQVMAQRIGHLTRLPSLELSCDYYRKSSGCDANYSCAYQYNISWKNATTPMAAEFNPRLAFERLFGTGSHGERAENYKRRKAQERSILDFVMADARAMNSRAGARDRDKLDQYLTGVRDIEKRIEKAEQFGAVADPDYATPNGVPVSYTQYVQLMYDMLALAFQTDSTRVASLLLAHDGSNLSFDEIGVTEGHHDISHHQNKPDLIKKVQKIETFYAEQFSRFLNNLNELKDPDGYSVLHNSQIVYGSGNADGNRHTHENLPMLLAGGGGGTLNAGRYVQNSATPASNLFVSMAQQAGLSDLTRFGDSTGALKNI
ncbi:MAG TPA: DUF1552 domain-containing protein [Tepidisphaeraceae bacterium]|jgi:hypothetical protein